MSFIAAVNLDRDGCPRHAHFDLLADLKATTVVDCRDKSLDLAVHWVIGGLASLGAVDEFIAAHVAIVVTLHRSNDPDPFHWVNTLIANLKTATQAHALDDAQLSLNLFPSYNDFPF